MCCEAPLRLCVQIWIRFQSSNETRRKWKWQIDCTVLRTKVTNCWFVYRKLIRWHFNQSLSKIVSLKLLIIWLKSVIIISQPCSQIWWVLYVSSFDDLIMLFDDLFHWELDLKSFKLKNYLKYNFQWISVVATNQRYIAMIVPLDGHVHVQTANTSKN